MARIIWTTVALALLTSLAAVAADPIEHPLIRPFPGSVLAEKNEYKDFDEYVFNVSDPETGRAEKKPVRGRYWKLTYFLRDETGRFSDKSHSSLEYIENYKQAALEKGGEILFESPTYLTFTLPADGGGRTWCEMHIWNYAQQDLRIIEEKGFERSLVFGPAELKAALDADGRVALYGILFDTDAAKLKQESDKQLQHILSLLIAHPSLRLEVQGHTDDRGSDDHNLELSQRRAETVVAYLTLFGIGPARLVARGYGEANPVAHNNTEEGWSQNRRVELVVLKD